jgi:hypothetical protein
MFLKDSDTFKVAISHSFPTITNKNHIHTLLSRLQVASRFPSGFQAQALTSFSWPSNVAWHSKLVDLAFGVISQTAVVPSKLEDARSFPSGLKHTHRTVRVCASVVVVAIQLKCEVPLQSLPAVLLFALFALFKSFKSQKQMERSPEQELREREVGDHEIPHTGPQWASSILDPSLFILLFFLFWKREKVKVRVGIEPRHSGNSKRADWVN